MKHQVILWAKRRSRCLLASILTATLALTFASRSEAADKAIDIFDSNETYSGNYKITDSPFGQLQLKAWHIPGKMRFEIGPLGIPGAPPITLLALREADTLYILRQSLENSALVGLGSSMSLFLYGQEVERKRIAEENVNEKPATRFRIKWIPIFGKTYFEGDGWFDKSNILVKLAGDEYRDGNIIKHTHINMEMTSQDIGGVDLWKFDPPTNFAGKDLRSTAIEKLLKLISDTIKP